VKAERRIMGAPVKKRKKAGKTDARRGKEGKKARLWATTC